MEPTASAACRDILDRLRAQVCVHLPQTLTQGSAKAVPVQVIPIERLPTIGAVVQQLIEAEAVYANATQPESQLSPPPNS